jgi:hypothetical protein
MCYKVWVTEGIWTQLGLAERRRSTSEGIQVMLRGLGHEVSMGARQDEGLR